MLVPVATQAESSTTGGPVVLLGIDSEDGGIGGHGPISVYADVIEDILDKVTNGGSGILVIGEAGDDDNTVKEFWDEIGDLTAQDITYVAGADNIAGQSFSGFAVLAVVTAEATVFQGSNPGDGLTNSENEALISRAGDVASFVNGGGGLFGSSQDGLDNPWGYVGGLGGFATTTGLSYSTIVPTDAGSEIGITTALNVCCWHDVFTEWPTFLEPLAWRSGWVDTQAAALGGAQVTIETEPEPSDDDPAVRLVKFWFDADGNRVGAPDDDWTVSLLVGDEVKASVDADDGSDWTPVSGNYSVSESDIPDDWEEVSCDGLDLPDIGTDYLDNSGTGDFSTSTTGAHAVCNQQPEVLAEVLEEAEPAEPVEAEPTFTG